MLCVMGGGGKGMEMVAGIIKGGNGRMLLYLFLPLREY